jgi:MFS family permease
MTDPSDEPRGRETEHARLNRELDQLLGELRVALPGVQVLLAFLLTVPFSDRFDRVTGASSAVFLASIALAAAASILLIAPTVHHRLRFREGTKEEMIHMGNRLTVAGVACLGLAIGCALYVVGDAGFTDTPARWLGPAMVVLAAITWVAVPMRYKAGQTRRDR